jgi:hypothetical protein
MGQDYIDELLRNRFYFKLLEHRNYSPRIIEELTIKKAWNRVKPAEIQELFSTSFNNPYFVWKDAFERQLKPISRCILLLMVSCGETILKEDIRKLLIHFLQMNGASYDASYSHTRFDNAIIELHNCFITTIVDAKGVMGLRFQNPSIQDFLLFHISTDERIIADIISSAQFLNQVLCFACWKLPAPEQRSIVLNWHPDKNRFLLVQQALIINFRKYKYYAVSQYKSDSHGNLWYHSEKGEYETLERIDKMVKEMTTEAIPLADEIRNSFQQSVSAITGDTKIRNVSAFVELLKRYGRQIVLNENLILDALLHSSSLLYDLISIAELKEIFPEAFLSLRNDKDRINQIFEGIYEYHYNLSKQQDWFQYLFVDNIRKIAKQFKLNLQKYWMKVPKPVPADHLKKRLDAISVPTAEIQPISNTSTERNEINLIFNRLASSTEILGEDKEEGPGF